MKIGFIGFGEVGAAFAASLTQTDGELAFLAYDIKLAGEGARGACAASMAAHGAEICTDPARLAGADWIVSAVTADQSLAAAEAACAWLGPGQCFLDINSVSPDRKRRSAEMVGAAGAAYVDMAVMAPVHPRGHRTPVLLAGALDPALEAEIGRLGFAFEIVGSEPGAATAIKMVRSLFVKGLEAITVETLLAASASGCLDYIQNSLATSFPGLGWPDFPAYQFERTLKHGRRRAAEMRESAATVEALGLSGALGEVIADIQQAMGEAGISGQANELTEVIDKALAARRAR